MIVEDAPDHVLIDLNAERVSDISASLRQLGGLHYHYLRQAA